MKKILLFIILFLCFIFNVKAESVTLTKEVYDNTYVYYYDSNLGKTRYLHASKYLFGTTAAYCLELGKDISSFEYEVNTSFDGINIKKSTLDYIKLVSYYGYNYPGHNTDNYYMATQHLIWRALVGTSIKFTRGFNPDDFYILTTEETQIAVLVNRHNIKPSFDNTTIDFSMGKEMTLEDSNNVLYLYYSDDDNVVIDGNKLIIKSEFDKKSITLKRHNYTNKEFFLYTSGNSQKMMSSGGISNSTSTINVNLKGGSISIKKLDRDTMEATAQGEASLEGAIYDLCDSHYNVIDSFIIGKKNRIDKLAIGRYYVIERKAGEGYLVDDMAYVIDITEDKLDINLTVSDKVIKRKVEIFKVYASSETGFLVGEENITFDIYDRNDNLVNQITTDSDGYASIYLPYGTYRIKQVNSTPNFYKIEDFYVTIDSNDDRPIFKLISDSEIKYKVKVIKKDYDTGDVIINGKASFKIFNVDKNSYVSFKTNYPKEDVIDTFDIGSDGTFVTPYELEPGNYILYEVDTDMDGYLYNKEGISFVVGEDSTTIKEGDDIIIPIYFYNKRVKGTLNILKYGEKIRYDNNYSYDKVLLDDVVFYLYADIDIYENSKLIYNKNDLVAECKTVNGVCSTDNLPLGDYYLKEISSSLGNDTDKSVYKIKFNYKDQYTENIVYNLSVNNYLPKGKVIINKYETGTKKGISNTLIEIRNMENVIVYKGYTDKNGQIILDDMLYGEYYLSEVEASSGYRLIYDKILFEVGEETTNIDIYNERIIVPNTGIGINYIDIIFIGFAFIFIFISLIFRKKWFMLFILIPICYFGIKFYRYYSDVKNNDKGVNAVINGSTNDINNDKYRYKAVLDIPSVKIKRGILDIDNTYNKAKYNVELVKEDDDIIVLASHNGNNYNSFFGNLKNISLGDEINYYYNGKLYKYIYTDSYEIIKNGYADIYRREGEKTIALITCKDNSNDGQIVFIGYLESILEY